LFSTVSRDKHKGSQATGIEKKSLNGPVHSLSLKTNTQTSHIAMYVHIQSSEYTSKTAPQF